APEKAVVAHPPPHQPLARYACSPPSGIPPLPTRANHSGACRVLEGAGVVEDALPARSGGGA
ncbi:MAG TPA: hypothetical protein VEZ19_00955, partial [Rubrobacter sp.]|nr:hypothetical protein [Rubrobacter sp.]